MIPSEIIELEKLAIILYHEQLGELGPAWQDLDEYRRTEIREEAYRMYLEMTLLHTERNWKL